MCPSDVQWHCVVIPRHQVIDTCIAKHELWLNTAEAAVRPKNLERSLTFWIIRGRDSCNRFSHNDLIFLRAFPIRHTSHSPLLCSVQCLTLWCGVFIGFHWMSRWHIQLINSYNVLLFSSCLASLITKLHRGDITCNFLTFATFHYYTCSNYLSLPVRQFLQLKGEKNS